MAVVRSLIHMIEKWIDLSESLNNEHIHSSAPTRVHCGGSTDHRLTGLICRSWRPATANIAVDLRAHVCLSGYETGRILVDINGVGKEEFVPPDLPLVGPYALVSALVCYFGVHGFQIEIETDFPYQSGLGGSGAVAVAVLGAVSAALNHEVPNDDHFSGIVQLAHNLEDSLFRNTGIQDQAAAVYGGAALWEWKYGDRLDFKRHLLVSDVSLLDEHILLAYTGRPHMPSQNGSQMLNRFKESGDVGLMVAISEQARLFAAALECCDYRSAGVALTGEYNLRSTLLPVDEDCDLELIEIATTSKCGVNLLGSGGGGCIWAIGEADDIVELRSQWMKTFESRMTGSVLPVKATSIGLEVTIGSKNFAAAERSGKHELAVIGEAIDARLEAL